MGDSRNGSYALRTPEEARRDLTIPVYAILLGRAVPIFTWTSLAGPSRKVGIFPTPGGSSGGKFGVAQTFPIWVDPDQWENAVRPVLEDPRFKPNTPINQYKLRMIPRQGYIQELGIALELSFRQAGYGPSL